METLRYRGKVKFEFDLFHYTIKADLKNETFVDTS